MHWRKLVGWTQRAYYQSNRETFELEPLSFRRRSVLRLTQIGLGHSIRPPASTGHPSLPSNWARLYLANGKIEFICLGCLEPICVVTTAHDASAHLDSHACRREEPKRSAVAAFV